VKFDHYVCNLKDKLEVKVKLSLCLTKYHAMKSYWGWRFSPTHSWPWH